MEVSVVVPVYNAEPNLPELARRLAAVLGKATTGFEIVLVNDGSPDGSWNLIQQLCSQYPQVRAINLMRNYGQHNALLCGIRAARHPVIVTIDDDLQHPPEEIPALLGALDANTDVVYGTPSSQPHGILRGMASIVTKWALQRGMGADIARKVSAFRVFRTELRTAFRDFSGSYVSVDVLLSWSTSRFRAITVRHDPRTRGASGYTFRKLVAHTFNMLTGFTVWPLRMASILGLVLTLFGVGVFCYVVIRYFMEGTPTPGFPFLASIISLFSGAQLFALGIIGEYLARMHFRAMQRPTYAVRETTDSPSSS